jgi:hypothetical protein
MPRLWDGAVETFLQTKRYTAATVRWSDRIANSISDSTTLLDAISRHIPVDGANARHRADDPMHERENHVRHMILAPLSPRKPIVIPCPAAAVRQRDKQKLEKVIRQRVQASAIGRLTAPVVQKENTRPYRAVTISRREFSSMRPINHTFYWGA